MEKDKYVGICKVGEKGQIVRRDKFFKYWKSKKLCICCNE